MQFASRGDYERKNANATATKAVAIPISSEPELAQAVKKVTYVKKFPLPPDTPKKVDHVKSIKPWIKQKRMIYAMWAVSAAVFIAGTGITVYSLIQNGKLIDQINGGEVAGIAGGPSQEYSASEEKPDIAGYSVDPNKPRYINIPKYNIQGRVIEVGVTEDNSMGVPKNIYDGGWYNDSIVPGSGAGASVINGHVSGYTQTGVFYNLKELNPGDKVTIEMGSGKVLNYEVVSKKTVSVDQFNILEVLNPVVAGSEGLNLITCGGSFDGAAQNYTERVLVFTKRV